MILADTSIVIERMRGRNAAITAVFARQPVMACGLVRAEVLSGNRSPVDRMRTLFALNLIPMLPMRDDDWDFIGAFRSHLFSLGLTASLPDVAVAGLAMIHEIPLWSRDNIHGQIASLIPALRLFPEPP